MINIEINKKENIITVTGHDDNICNIVSEILSYNEYLVKYNPYIIVSRENGCSVFNYGKNLGVLEQYLYNTFKQYLYYLANFYKINIKEN